MSIYDRIVIAAIRLVQKVHEDRTGTVLLPFESIMGVIIIVIPTDDRIADVQWFIIQPASKIFIDLLQFMSTDTGIRLSSSVSSASVLSSCTGASSLTEA